MAILPVRVDSRRLPRKALLAESGQPLFLHTYAAARGAASLAAVYIATDSDEVAAAAAAVGAPVIRTSARPRTGSERCAEALTHVADADVVIDVQGDWPEVDPGDLDRLVASLADGRLPMATLAAPLRDGAAFTDPNVVKVVRRRDGHAMYFSRAPIPYGADAHDYPVLRHIGVYGFTRPALAGITDLPSSGLAEAESLEQLRFLENGIPMLVLDAQGDPWGIETRSDYDGFLHRLRRHHP
ncbi:MAG: 3-deoxy-manno-octulosonate cytidylyltransferase [Planctomycetota bacterium]